MMRILGDRVLVALPPKQAERVRASGIVLALRGDVEAATRGIVCELGTVNHDVEIGDCVMFPPNVGESFEQDGVWYLILRESDILATMDPTGREADWLDRLAEIVNSARKAVAA